jgi:hypothetical protein
MIDLISLLAEEAAATAAAEAAAAAATEAAASAIPEMAVSAIPEAAASVMPEALASAAPIPAMATPMSAPMSVGQQIGSSVGNAFNKQTAPVQSLFKTIISPDSTSGDMARAGFDYALNTKEEELEQPRMFAYPNQSAYMSDNYIGGIPSLLQNTSSGILPYIGGR